MAVSINFNKIIKLFFAWSLDLSKASDDEDKKDDKSSRYSLLVACTTDMSVVYEFVHFYMKLLLYTSLIYDCIFFQVLYLNYWYFYCYRDVCYEGLDQPLLLPRSNEYDCVLCSYIADIDWDGENEIILGSYGQV